LEKKWQAISEIARWNSVACDAILENSFLSQVILKFVTEKLKCINLLSVTKLKEL